jgi:hypothetical protein
MAAAAELEELKAEREALGKQLAAFAESDPSALKRSQEMAAQAKAASDRWTDNVFTLKSYLVNKFGKEPREADVMLQIKEDFDYVP